MQLEGLIKRLDSYSGIYCDSRAVSQGGVFVAVKGSNADGHDFIREAVSRGARAVVFQDARTSPGEEGQVRFIKVQDSRLALVRLAGEFYGHPSRSMQVVGITGTNGKTTVSYLLEAILKACGRKPGVIGTVSCRYNHLVLPAKNTTPGPLELQGMLARMKDGACDCAVLEVSSHALDQGRTGGVRFSSAIFTNISRDHLDYHPSMEDYFLAKNKLFSAMFAQRPEPGFAVTNIDDPYGIRLQASGKGRVVSYAITKKADVRASRISQGVGSSQFLVSCGAKEYLIKTCLIGRHNVYNILAAFAWAVESGLDPLKTSTAIMGLGSVPGRMERIEGGAGFSVFVDYAHTEDALRKALETLKGFSPKRLILVFGCGGQRDKGKRPKMGQAACQMADLTLITDDNPRQEDPQEIINQVKEGFSQDNYLVIRDRRQAIGRAISEAGPGDIVLIAGKGHEDTQIIGQSRIPFDDRKIARECLRQAN